MPPTDPIPDARRARVLVLVAAVLIATALACSPKAESDAVRDGIRPVGSVVPGVDASPTTAPPAGDASSLITVPPGFVPPDNRAIALTPVTGKPKPFPEVDLTKPSLAIEGGTSKLTGTVFGPDGPLEKAHVRLERWVGLGFGRLDVETNKDGRYVADDLLGGRYKIRAWIAEDSLATVSPQLVFLSAKEGEANVDVGVERRDGLLLQGALDRATPHVGEPAVLTTLLAQEFVDDEGVVRGRGVPAAVLVAHASIGVAVDGDGYGTTDPEGVVLFTVACTGIDVPTVTLESSGLATTVTLPECLPPEATTTTEPATTTTTTPAGAAAATTTTGPPRRP